MPETNIMTAEDPVEFNLAGVNQVQMKESIGLNFAAALRSFLRQDPNIVLVGEIRDFETAEIAVKAALTGHLVLSTLHTNDAPSTVNRLMNMGIEPFLVATSVHLICAQRLVRRICKECKAPMDEFRRRRSSTSASTPEEAKACTAYRRVVAAERATTPATRDASACTRSSSSPTRFGTVVLLEGASSIELKRARLKEGMITLRMKRTPESPRRPDDHGRGRPRETVK